MSHNPQNQQQLKTPSFTVRFGQMFRRYFVTGLATLFPLTVTFWLLLKIFMFADGFLGQYLGFRFPGLGLLITVLIIFGVGVLSVHFFGRLLFRTVEAWVSRLPLVSKIYPTVKQFANLLFAEKGQPMVFRRVVLVQYPRIGIYSVAFVTNEAQTTILGTPKMLLTMMIPTPPSPLTGPIIIMPEEDVIPLDVSIEDTLKWSLSGGVVSPQGGLFVRRS